MGVNRLGAAAALRSARKRARLSQVELAMRAGVTQSVISAYESGRRQPSVPTLAALVEAAGYELEVGVREPRGNLSRPDRSAATCVSTAMRTGSRRQVMKLTGMTGGLLSKTGGPPITVITITRRPTFLSRCIESVRQQTYPWPIRHLIVIDDKPEILALSRGLSVPSDDVVLVPRRTADRDGPSRLAVLRNLAVSMADNAWMAFLDDDNAWEPEHLETLWTTVIEQSADIAHSQRQVFDTDGCPYLRQEFPWGRDETTRRAIYAYCLEAGIMSRGSNIVRDRLEMRFTWIDLGEWLFPPGFLTQHPFETEYGPWEWFNITVEDKALPKAIYTSGLRVAATERPTLHYYLGGYTNTFEGEGVVWREPDAVHGRESGWQAPR